jgi:hypothetical protein
MSANRVLGPEIQEHLNNYWQVNNTKHRVKHAGIHGDDKSLRSRWARSWIVIDNECHDSAECRDARALEQLLASESDRMMNGQNDR